MKFLFDWIEDRTGLISAARDYCDAAVPGGARWSKILPAMITFAFVVQILTGLSLWMYYSPSAQTAWESVFYIQYEMQGGWLLRGIHHYTAQAMVVLLALHLLQVVIDGAYRAPREINFWIGLIRSCQPANCEQTATLAARPAYRPAAWQPTASRST